MKLVKFLKDGASVWAEKKDEQLFVLQKPPYEGGSHSGEVVSLRDVKLLAPCDASKVVCVGKNYADHAMELGGVIPKNPILFIKPSTTIIADGDHIVYPAVSSRVDFEGELCFVVKKMARNVKAADFAEYILGYTCLNDVTARDIQASDEQWTRAKSFDTFCPIGAVLTDEIDPNCVSIKTELNGQIKQDSNTTYFMWKIGELFEFITRGMTLLPGDVVTTGTPSGIGPMQIGDVVTVTIEGIGTLQNTVIGE